MKSKYTKIGTIYKSSGTNGEVKIDIDEYYWDDFMISDHIFIIISGSYVPYFIENIRETNNLLLKIEEIDNPESASILSMKDIYLSTHKIQNNPEQKQEKKPSSLIGYTIYDGESMLGIIHHLEKMPKQTLAYIIVDQKDIAIPMVDQLIENIDNTKKILYMNLPEGLLDL